MALPMPNFESTPSHIDSHGPGGRRKEIEESARPAPNVEDAGPRRDVGRDNRFADRCCFFRPRALANLPPPNFLVEHAGGASDRPSSHLISRRRDGLKSLFPRLVGVRPEGVRVSVVVTVKNDPRVIDCAERVLSQDASFPFELVIVDNGSTNEPPRLLRDRFANNPRVTILSSGGNLSEAWNHAAATARGRVLVRIDADAIPLPGWLTALATPILDGQADWTAGPVGGASPHGSLVERYYHHRTEAYSRRLAQDAGLRVAVRVRLPGPDPHRIDLLASARVGRRLAPHRPARDPLDRRGPRGRSIVAVSGALPSDRRVRRPVRDPPWSRSLWDPATCADLNVAVGECNLSIRPRAIPLRFYSHDRVARPRLTLVGHQKDIDGMGRCSARQR